MSRPVRVLSLYEGFFAGGARILHSDLVSGLHSSAGQEHAVLSIASAAGRESTVQQMEDDPRYRRLRAAGVGITALGRTAGVHPPERTSFTDEELLRAADAVAAADVVLSLKEQPVGLLLALRDRGLIPDVPVAVCLHRSDPLHSGPALGWLVEATATGLVTATVSCAESTSEAYARAGVTADSRFVIANGIDTDRFRPGDTAGDRATRDRLGISDGAPVVVFAARFDAMKDPGLFLRSAAAHARTDPDTHYVLCGAGMTWDNAAFAALAHESGVAPSSRVHPLGIVEDMPSVYRIADIVALTSAFGEASPLCLVEGAACGATPVTTDVGDAARRVEGIGVVTSHDASEIAAAWTDVLAGRGGLREAALASRPRFGRDRMIEEYRSAVEDLVAARAAEDVALAG
ncbi:glycosyltransferase [Labedella endophytica]|uniref:Glycosyltransferase n=1 Tax=Labedella endophytica TaxID=1523160 RepID=A0A3S0VIN8_9MICO|nr:glycosyltransferase [Labedella endophytica]RUR03446.1 glycosyltransferase [Labedella endophytica]